MAESCEIEMDLDFHIEFPSAEYDLKNIGPNSNSLDKKTAGEKSQLLSSSENNTDKIWPVHGYEDKDGNKSSEKELVVVLLGWAGSQHKHLAKYSDIYLSRGCIVLRYIAPVKALFVSCRKLPILANRVVRLLKDLQLDSHPIFFHVFSNGGAFMYSYILKELSLVQKSIQLDIRGTIFDSSPTPRHLGKCFMAVSNIFVDFNIFRYLIASLVVMILAAQVFWYHFKSAVQLCMFGEPLEVLDANKSHPRVEEVPLKDWLGRLCKMRNHNCLYIYSDTDDLIPWKQVEHVADVTANYGNRVEKKKFLGSEHVQHYRKYPVEYVATITEFIRKTMKRSDGSAILWDGR